MASNTQRRDGIDKEEFFKPRVQVDYYSFSLNMNTHATVILPQTGKDFLSGGVRRNKDGKIPVLWLLHGFGDDSTSWERYTHVERYALARGIAVVMPGVLSQCFYSNMVKGLPYFDHIANEVPALFREMFPQLSDAPEDNFIAGLSMGGYGALKIGLTYPERYAAIGCVSAGNLLEIGSILPPTVEEAPLFMRPMYGVARNAFGTEKMADALGTEHDVKHLLDKALDAGKALPQIKMYCGTEDFVLPLSDSMAQHIAARGLTAPAFTYEKGPGTHHWDFWDHYLPVFMDACGLTSMLEASQVTDVTC